MKIAIKSDEVDLDLNFPVVLRGFPDEGSPLIILNKGNLSLLSIRVGPEDDLDAAALIWLNDLIATLNRLQSEAMRNEQE